MGVSIQFFMYDWDIKHSFSMLVIAYVIMNVFQREKQHIIVFVVLYAYQSGIHLEIMYRKYGEWGTEITSFTMNLVCKLISVAICYRDASPKCKDDNDNDMKLAKIPSFFKMTAYTFNLPS